MNPTIQRDGVHGPINLPIPAAPTEKAAIKSPYDELLEDMPAVFQFPVFTTVRARFYEAGPHVPLPFPEGDD